MGRRADRGSDRSGPRAPARHPDLRCGSIAALSPAVPGRAHGAVGGARPPRLPAEAAQAIGWAPSPFQSEVGAANLGIGLAGLYAAFRSYEARFATALAVAGFLCGAGVVHISDIIRAGNFAAGNAGPILFTDFLTPIAVFLLLAATRGQRPEKNQS